MYSVTTEHSFHAVVVPRQAFSAIRQMNHDSIADELNFKKKRLEIRAANLVTHLATLLSLVDQSRWKSLKRASKKAPSFEEDALRFAEVVAFQRVFPVDQPTVTRESLATLAVTPSQSSNQKTWLGFVNYLGHPLLLLVHADSGLIVGGSGQDAGEVLEIKGLRNHVLTWLKLLREQPNRLNLDTVPILGKTE
jgi:hypothetical protein